MRLQICKFHIASVYNKEGNLSFVIRGYPECLEKEALGASYEINGEDIKPRRIQCSNSSSDIASCEIDTLEPFPTQEGLDVDITVDIDRFGSIYACIIEKENQTEC